MAVDLRPEPAEVVPALPGPIAYLTGEYPKVSHTFIQREVAVLRSLGFRIETCTIRRAAASDIVGPDQQAEARRTFGVIPTAMNPLRLLAAHAAILRTSPRNWLAAARLAWQTRSPGPKALLWQFFYFAEAGVLAHHLKTMGAVHLHNHFASSSANVGLLAATMANLPFSFTLHGPSEFFEAPRWHLGTKLAHASFAVAISHFCRSQLMYFSDRRHWDRIHIVHCGIDPARFGRSTDRAAGKHVAFVGRLDPVKGADLLLDALARLRKSHPELSATLIGDGPHGDEVRRHAKRLGLEDVTRFLGAQPEDQVARLLSDADLLVLPSFAEGLPVVLMEAMASGLPVIASRIAGVPELVEHGRNGLLVPAGDVNSLASAMDALLSDPRLCQDMGRRGCETVCHDFNLDTETRRLATLFLHHIAQGGQPDPNTRA